MYISRRKFLQTTTAITAGAVCLFKSEVAKPFTHREVLSHKLHDKVSFSLLDSYARCMALVNEDARWQAQMMFHEAQLARQGGGTMSHTLGYQLYAFLEAQEHIARLSL